MAHGDALAILDSRGNEVQGIHLGLQRIRTVLRTLGDPQLSFPALHIAGTNGKGSVAAMSESILRKAGYRTGLYTSPHLVEVEERIQVAGAQISRSRLARLLATVASTESALLTSGALERPMTYFELITACAFVHFAACRVDIAIVEVGLGGALDATNVVVPAACVITGISYDHQDLLGPTLGKIAAEKAGIIKRGTPVVSACRSQVAGQVVRRAARRHAAPLVEIGREFRIGRVTRRGDRFSFDLETPEGKLPRLRLALAGAHQIRNAALAVAAVAQLEQFPVARAHIRAGLLEVRWPGRLEEFHAARLTILDGAHNAEAARALAAHLRLMRRRQIRIVFAALRDKDIRGMARHLFPIALRIYLAPLANSRSADPISIVATALRHRSRISIHPSARQALERAWKESPPDGLVVAAGSLYLVGELLPLVRRRSRTQR